MSFLESVLIVTLDCALESLTLACADNVDSVAYSKSISLYDVSDIKLITVIKSDLLEC